VFRHDPTLPAPTGCSLPSDPINRYHYDIPLLSSSGTLSFFFGRMSSALSLSYICYGATPLRMDAFMGMEIDFLAWPSLFLSWWALVQASSQRRRNLFTHLLYLGKAHPKYSLSIWPDKARERISHASDTWDSSFRYAPPFHEHNHHAWRRFSKRITNDKRDR